MERLVEWNRKEKNSALPKCINEWGDVVPLEDICAQLATIYDILGDCDLDRLRELVDADKDGRIIIIPDFVWKIGETQGVVKVPYKHWMGRFIGTKFYRTEQETKAAQKGDPNQ